MKGNAIINLKVNHTDFDTTGWANWAKKGQGIWHHGA
jgi:hypothetical protein